MIISLTEITLCLISHVWALHGSRKEELTFAFQSPWNTVPLFMLASSSQNKTFLNSLDLWKEKMRKVSMKHDDLMWETNFNVRIFSNEINLNVRSHFLHPSDFFRHSDNNHCLKRRITELAWTLTQALQPVGFWRLQYLWGKETYRK